MLLKLKQYSATPGAVGTGVGDGVGANAAAHVGQSVYVGILAMSK